MSIEEPKPPEENEKKDQDPRKDIVKSVFDEKPERPQKSSVFGQPTPPPVPVPEVPSPSVPEPIPPADPTAPVVPAPAVSPQPKPVVRRKTRFRRHPAVGIDIGAFSVKLAQLDATDDGPKVRNLILEEYPRPLRGNIHQQPAVLKEFLRDLLSRHHIKGEVYSSVPSHMVHLKRVVMPKMPESEIPEALKWEIKQMSGINADDLTYDYTILNKDQLSNPDKIETMVVIASKKEILEHLALLESVGLKSLAVEPEAMSLLASCEYNQELQPHEVILLLDFGGCSTRLNIIRNRELHFSRVLNVNGESLTRAIRDYCQVSEEEAERLKREYVPEPVPAADSSDNSDTSGSKPAEEPDNHSRMIRHAISLLLEKMVSDIEHTFKYYSYQVTKSQIIRYERIILSGGSANFPMLESFLKERLNVPVVRDDPLRTFRGLNPAMPLSGIGFKDTVRLGVALGLALRDIEG